MKTFKSISVKAETFNEIKRLTETLLPKVKLSHSQVVESAIRNCSREDKHEGNNATDRIQEKGSRKKYQRSIRTRRLDLKLLFTN